MKRQLVTMFAVAVGATVAVAVGAALPARWLLARWVVVRDGPCQRES